MGVQRNIKDPETVRLARELAGTTGRSVIGLTVARARIGRAGYQAYGRGTGHPARLNFGGCFAYALAKETGQPLLFKVNGFIHTDVVAAV
jgi:ribonuclease VapC